MFARRLPSTSTFTGAVGQSQQLDDVPTVPTAKMSSAFGSLVFALSLRGEADLSLSRGHRLFERAASTSRDRRTAARPCAGTR